MTETVKKFIEENIGLIEYEEWDSLLEQAYEWLSDEQCKDLISVLSNTLNVNLTPFVIDFLRAQIRVEMENFSTDFKHAKIARIIYIHTFIRRYFNHVLGFPFKDFINIVKEEAEQSKKVSFIDNVSGPYLKVGKK